MVNDNKRTVPFAIGRRPTLRPLRPSRRIVTSKLTLMSLRLSKKKISSWLSQPMMLRVVRVRVATILMPMLRVVPHVIPAGGTVRMMTMRMMTMSHVDARVKGVPNATPS